MKTIGEIVTANREAAKLSFEQLAELTGLSDGYLRDLENDRYSDLSTHTLKLLRSALPDLSCEEILKAAPAEKRVTPKRGRGRPPKPKS